MGSAGIGQPFKVLQQYLIHIGKEVEILTKEGKKLEGQTLRTLFIHYAQIKTDTKQ